MERFGVIKEILGVLTEIKAFMARNYEFAWKRIEVSLKNDNEHYRIEINLSFSNVIDATKYMAIVYLLTRDRLAKISALHPVSLTARQLLCPMSDSNETSLVLGFSMMDLPIITYQRGNEIFTMGTGESVLAHQICL